jgi:uncharacterized protein (TIGR02246 family)
LSDDEKDILAGVLSAWKSAVDAHDPDRVASVFTEDAIFQGLRPYGVGREDVAAYYDGQPRGLTADFALLESRRLADDVVLGYSAVDFGFADRPALSVHLGVLLRRIGGTWLIGHYQVSRLD